MKPWKKQYTGANKMKKISVLLIILVFGAVSTIFSGGKSVIDRSVFKMPQRSQSLFNHDEHNENANLSENCAVCHHVYEGKKLVEDESSEDDKCSSCHQLKRTKENSVPIRRAFHKRCKSCHFENNKGPVLCGECHKK